jgi:hypothetical protein
MDNTAVEEPSLHKGIVYALLAAALFGASTPFSKILVSHVAPVALAGLLYLGSGIGLLACYLVRALVQRADQDKPVALKRIRPINGSDFADTDAREVILHTVARSPNCPDCTRPLK